MENKFYKTAENGIVLNLKIITNAKKNEISGVTGDFLKIKLNAIPEKGRANYELVSFLSEKLNIKKSDIIIISGEKSKEKKVLIKTKDINKIYKNLF